MPKGKLAQKSEGVRLPETDRKWLTAWQEETAQPKATMIRAAVRMLRIVTRDLPYDARVRLIATLSERAEGEAQDDEFWIAVGAALAARRGKKR